MLGNSGCVPVWQEAMVTTVSRRQHASPAPSAEPGGAQQPAGQLLVLPAASSRAAPLPAVPSRADLDLRSCAGRRPVIGSGEQPPCGLACAKVAGLVSPVARGRRS